MLIAYLILYRFIWLALFGLMACGVLWQIAATIPILRDPAMRRDIKIEDLLKCSLFLLLFLVSLGDQLHWPSFALTTIQTLMAIVFICDIPYFLCPKSQRLERNLQHIQKLTAGTIQQLRQEGAYPAAGQVATDDEIRRLLKTEYGIYAVVLYQEAHKVDFKAAIKGIIRLRRELVSA